MALSFEESKKQALSQATTPMLMSLSPDTNSENWSKPDNYTVYEYYDEYRNGNIII